MNLFDHTHLWAEADVRFYNQKDHKDDKNENLPPGSLILRYHQVAFADTYQVNSITLFSKDWTESIRLTSNCWSSSWSRQGHNWFGVTRLDFGICPPGIPFYFWGYLITGGMNSTFHVRRLRTTHRLTNKIPGKAAFIPLDDGVWHATWSERRQLKETFAISAGRSWHFGKSPEDAIKHAVIARFRAAA